MRRNQLVTQAFAVHSELDKAAPMNGDGHSKRLQALLDEMHSEFGRRRKIQISGLPPDFTEKTILEILPGSKCKLVSGEKGGVAKLLFPDSQSCKTALQVLSRRKVGEHKLQAQYGHPDSLLFVGNLPLAYTSSELHDLFSSFGEIHRCFIVYSPNSGSSKGYGFVELSCKEEAMAAKQKMATKQVGCRSLRVDFADNGMQTCADLQSHTLFVDKLPKSLKGECVLKELFSQYGVVNFCQIALTASNTSRGFAFVDMASSDEAEKAQINCNGAVIKGQEIRVSFSMPCRPGACILQPRNNPALPTNWPATLLPATGLALGTSIPSTNLPSILSLNLAKMKEHQDPATLFLGSFPSSMGRQPLHPSSSNHSLIPPASTASSSLSMSTKISPPVFQNSLQLLNDKQCLLSTSSVCMKENVGDCFTVAGRKRKHQPSDDSGHRSSEASELMGVYDKPYIGQHQQGIPYTHPLKRIRQE